ncbi:hypothetical protein Ancab_019795 [Ancistrocladus abbreviatus]
MNGVRLNGKAHSYEKPIPGCLGRMVCLFDLTSNVASNKMLTEKPHCDGSPRSRSRSDVSRMSSPIVDDIEDKVIVSELRRSSSGKRSEGTPMKMLIAQEMSKDLESRSNSPNVVAKLMGLDTLPQQQLPDLASKRSHSRCNSQYSNPELLTGYWQPEHGLFDREIGYEVPQYQEQNECRDAYETWQQPQRTNRLRDVSPCKIRCNENTSGKKMALISQKFMELKHLATDEKLRQTKEFQDAVEVLNSHRDLFVKFLQEQNSLFSHHLYAGHFVPPPAETKRITVLRPSKLVFDDKIAAAGKKTERQIKKLTKVDEAKRWNNHHHGFSPTIPSWKSDDSSTQPTKIVVLKPNLVKNHELKAVASSTPSSPGNLRGGSLFEEPVPDETHEARAVAKEITQQMHENLAGDRRDETLLSSVLSNGYTGDESSFNKSEAEFVVGNLSDSEVMSPASRHSWDYVNRYSGVCSPSSFSRASYSPESSVCREAKKRLSERWAMMASNGINREHKHMRRNSSTLGEMLVLSDTKKPERSEEEDSIKVQGSKGSTSCLNSSLSNGGSVIESRSLMRSNSVPLSSTAHSGGLSVEVPGPEACKLGSPNEAMKGKTTKPSFKGKFTSLFFPKNKKSGKEKSGNSQSMDETPIEAAEVSGSPMPIERVSDDISKSKKNICSEDTLCPSLEFPSCSVSPDFDGVSPLQAGLSVSRPAISRISGENQDQPSPISVLDQLFEEDDGRTLGCSSGVEAIQHGKQSPPCFSRSNLIDKSPPIGSIARTLSWNECSVERAAPYPLKSPFLSPGTEADEGEWLFLVQSLLSAAGLDSMVQLCSNFARWHSPESPLDPLLREKYVDLTSKDPLHEAKGMEIRSNCKLVFDCVNAVLVDMVGVRSNISQWASTSVRANDRLLGNTSPLLADGVWARIKEWFCGEMRWLSDDDGGDGNSLVERVVRKELVGKSWAESVRLEVDNIGKEIEGKLLEDLVEESVVEWTCRR